MHGSTLRRPRLCPTYGHGHLIQKDEEQPPEDAVKVGGLPAMLKALREKRATLMTTTSLAALDRGEPVTLGVESFSQVDENENRLQERLETSDLEEKIVRQVEYYFGDYNLPKDRFMHEQMDSEGWISMEVMLTFKRLRQLSMDVDLIMEAVNKSGHKIVQVDFSGRQIRRHPDNPLMVKDEAKKLEIRERTVFVFGLNREGTSLDDMLEFFDKGDFGRVCDVRMRYRYNPKDERLEAPDEIEDRKFLGSVFVTFEFLQDAKDFIKRCKTGEGVKFRNRRLNAKFQQEFLDQRIENNDEFSPEKVMRTVYVRGFDKTDLSDRDVADFFSTFAGAETVKKRVYRDNNSQEEAEGEWKFNGSVFVCFEDEKAAEAFIRLHRKNPIRYHGDKLRVKTQLEFYEEMGKFRRRICEFKDQ